MEHLLFSSNIDTTNRILSFFGRVNYSLLDRYLLTVTFRADGSSKFSPEHRWEYFPAAAFGWRLSEEAFMKDIDWLDNLKLRLSYGTVGNDGISSDLWSQIWTSETDLRWQYATGHNYWSSYDYATSEMANQDLKWETTITRNVGLDFGFFKNRLWGSVDLYWNTTKDLLMLTSIPGITGFTSIYANIGQTSNKGLELSLSGVLFENKDWSITAGMNINFNRGNVDELVDNVSGLYCLTYTLMDVPFWAMIPAFSNDAKVRNEISMLSRLFATFGGQMMSTIGLLVIACLGVNMGASESDGYLRFAVIVAVVFNICEIICVRNVSEHVVIKNKRDIKLSEVLNFLKENDQLLIIIFMTILQQIAVFLWTGMNIYFFKYVVCHEEWFSIFGIVNFIVGSIGLIAFPSLANKFSRKVVYILSAILLVLGLLGMFFVGDDHKASVVLFFSVASLFCLGNALAGVSTTVMLADTVDYGEYKCGVRSEAIVFSVQTFTAKFGSAIAGFIGAMVLSLVGYVPNVMQTADTILGLRLMMFVASASLFIIILFIYLKFYKLNGSFYQNILDELVIMRKNNN